MNYNKIYRTLFIKKAYIVMDSTKIALYIYIYIRSDHEVFNILIFLLITCRFQSASCDAAAAAAAAVHCVLRGR